MNTFEMDAVLCWSKFCHRFYRVPSARLLCVQHVELVPWEMGESGPCPPRNVSPNDTDGDRNHQQCRWKQEGLHGSGGRVWEPRRKEARSRAAERFSGEEGLALGDESGGQGPPGRVGSASPPG